MRSGWKKRLLRYLTVLNGNNAGAVLQLREMSSDILVGRSRKADFVIEDECISREHARVRRDLHGIHIVDLGSRNGVLINSVQVQGTQRLSSGDEVRLGTTKLKFTDPAAAMLSPGVKSPKREEDVEGTIIRPTEAMEVSEVEDLIAQSRDLAAAGAPEASVAVAAREAELGAEVEQAPQDQAYDEPESRPDPIEDVPVEPEPAEVEDEPIEEQLVEEEPVEEDEEVAAEESDDELVEEDVDVEEEEDEEEGAEEAEDDDEEEYEDYEEEEEEDESRSLLVPLIIGAVVLLVFTVAMFFVLF